MKDRNPYRIAEMVFSALILLMCALLVLVAGVGFIVALWVSAGLGAWSLTVIPITVVAVVGLMRLATLTDDIGERWRDARKAWDRQHREVGSDGQ